MRFDHPIGQDPDRSSEWNNEDVYFVFNAKVQTSQTKESSDFDMAVSSSNVQWSGIGFVSHIHATTIWTECFHHGQETFTTGIVQRCFIVLEQRCSPSPEHTRALQFNLTISRIFELQPALINASAIGICWRLQAASRADSPRWKTPDESPTHSIDDPTFSWRSKLALLSIRIWTISAFPRCAAQIKAVSPS